MAQIKSKKPVVISNSALNSQGFRMLTEGAVLDEFEKNPLLLFNHIRPKGNKRNQILPLGNIVDWKIEGDNIIGFPAFDDDDEFAMSICKKWESGTLRMASAGAEPLEASSASKDLLPGQKKETVTKWKLKEVSICDIGANPEALAIALYDHDGQMITLSESIIKDIPNDLKTPDMKKNEKAEEPKKEVQLKKLSDADTKKKDEALEKELSDDEGDEKDKEIASLKAKLAEMEKQLKLATEGPEKELAEADDEDAKKETKLAATALRLGKIRLNEVQSVIQLAKADYAGTVAMLKAKKTEPTIKSQLDKSDNVDDTRVVELSKKSYDELFSSGGLQFLKLNAPDVYKSKFKSKFGKEPKNL